MAQAFQASCGLDGVILLQNEQATLGVIRAAIYEEMVRQTQPGDTVFLFFSCHGGRCADTNGDEEDGLDEYIIPADGKLGKPETMVLDDMFARWIAALDGRQVFIILDNCYSGGSSKGFHGELLKDVKGIDEGGQIRTQGADVGLHRRRAKSSQRPGAEGNSRAGRQSGRSDRMGDDQWQRQRLDVLGGKALGIPETDADHDGRVSVRELFDTVKLPVARYVKETFNARQDPILIDNDSPDCCQAAVSLRSSGRRENQHHLEQVY